MDLFSIRVYDDVRQRSYVLLRPGESRPAFGVYERLPPEAAFPLLMDSILGHISGPNFPLLRALGIYDHPYNLGVQEIVYHVRRALAAASPVELLREVERPLEVGVRSKAGERTPSEPAPALSRRDAWIGFSVLSDDKAPRPSTQLALTLPDGSVRTLSSDAKGQVLVTGLQPGPCKVSLPRIDASAWKAGGALPSVLERARSRTHAVQPGECLSQLAHAYGLSSWQKVWDDPENAALRKKRKSPHVLYPGDVVVVPGVEIGEVPVATEAMHTIVVSTKPLEVELVLAFANVYGEPLEGEPFELLYTVDGEPQKREGTLDGGGGLRERVPVSVRSATVTLKSLGLVRRVAVGHLDPSHDSEVAAIISGTYARLQALGFAARDHGEGPLSALQAAVAAFQREVMGQEAPTGELDAATCAKLEESYGI